MGNLNGFVKLHRKMVEWGWYSDSVVKDVFIHILMVAAWKDGAYLGHEIKPGQAIIGRKKMAKELGFSERQIRTALDKLESTGEITRKTTNKFTIVTVENWEFYQCDGVDDDQQMTNKRPTDDQQMTNKRPTDDHILRKKESKEGKESKKVKKSVCIPHTKHAHGKFQNVFLTERQYRLFTEAYANADEMVESLSNYKERKGESVKIGSDYAMLEHFAKDDGIKNVKKDLYKRYLAEAKLGFRPPDNAGLTEAEYEELSKIAEENE